MYIKLKRRLKTCCSDKGEQKISSRSLGKETASSHAPPLKWFSKMHFLYKVRMIRCSKVSKSLCSLLLVFTTNFSLDTQTIFGNLQCRKFNCSSCRCLYRIEIFVVVVSLIYPNIILQRQSYVIKFGYYYAHTSAFSKIRHRLDCFFKAVKEMYESYSLVQKWVKS